MFVTYNPSKGFPQSALFGRGIKQPDDTHTPPEGMTSFEVDKAELIHGTDERLYEVVDGPKLRAFTDSEVEALRLPAAKSAAQTAVDDKAGEVRLSYLTEIPGQQGTYLEKRNDAQAFKDAGYPEASIDSYPWVKAKAAALGGSTGEAAADTILTTANQWTQVVGPAIEQQREDGKRLVGEAADVASVESARDNAIAALEALKP